MTTPTPFSLPVDNRILHGVVHRASRPGRRPVIVICHGFKGFMEWGFFPSLSELLSSRGYCVVRFNFSGSGMLPGDELVSDPEAFAHATFSKDLQELQALLHSIGEIAPDSADPGKVGVIGHSRGGGTALLAAAAESSPVRVLVTWAAVSTFSRFPAATVDQWRREGQVPIVNARTGQELSLDVEVLNDLEGHRARFDLTAAAARRSAPWLIVHGTADETVPFDEARTLASAARIPVDLLRIEGADHTLGARHPFAGPTPQLTEAMNATQTFLRRHLR